METRNIVITTLRNYEVIKDQKSSRIYLLALGLFLISIMLSSLSYSINPIFPVAFILPSGFILCRLFVIQHDCGHYSLFTKRSYNKIGGTILGFLTMIPSNLWNHIHDTHHGLVGNLNERVRNPELWTLTVNEYKEAGIAKRISYRLFRSMIMRLFITPIIWMLAPRIPLFHLGIKIFVSIIIHDILYGIVLYFIVTHNLFFAFTIIYLIPLYVFNFMASIFFYVQHQFEDTVWSNEDEWNLYDASLYGSSYLVVGKFLSWVSGNVGCHHVHHLNTKIPCYLLPAATKDANQYLNIEPIYIKELFHHLRCVLWDEDAKKLVSIKSQTCK
jgi:omega-6 fatty acid desaturase (delta-12 desaturase)